MKEKKTIGILGGMGPDATAYLFSSIIRQTQAQTDQDHVHILIDNNPRIPDRSAFILGRGPDPLPAMIQTARQLEDAGAHLIIIPCNTAHYFLKSLVRSLNIPVLDMIAITAGFIHESYPLVKKSGLLATLGTYHTHLYEQVFASFSMEVLVPDEHNREAVMAAIYGEQGIKAGYREGPAAILVDQSEKLVEQGAETIICGCTEISLVLKQDMIPIRLVNPLDILAREAIVQAGYEAR